MKYKNKLAAPLLIAASLSIVACNDEGGSSGSTSVSGLSSIVGIYDWSDTYEGGIVDEWYIGIDAEGNVSDYDYLGDAYDDYMNCYSIDKNWDQLTHISGNRFSSNIVGEVTITKSSSGLTIVPEDENYSSLVTGEKVSMTVSDFEAADCNSANSAPMRTVKSLGRSFK